VRSSTPVINGSNSTTEVDESVIPGPSNANPPTVNPIQGISQKTGVKDTDGLYE